MAFLTPVLLALVMGMIEAARLGMVCQLLTTAAREGCRVAVLNGMTQSDVQDRINTVLNGSGISVGTVTPTIGEFRATRLKWPVTVATSTIPEAIFSCSRVTFDSPI